MGTETWVPQRSPSRSPNVHRKPWNKASHPHRNGRCGQLRSLQAGQSQSSTGRKTGPSEPHPLQRWGPQTQVITARSDGQSGGRDARTHVQPRAAPPPGRAPSHSNLTRLPGVSGPTPPPRHSHIPTTGRLAVRGAGCPVLSASPPTWNPIRGRAGTPTTDPRPRLRARNYKSQKAGA